MRATEQEKELREEFITKLLGAITWAGDNDLDINFVISEVWCALNGITLSKRRHRDGIKAILEHE